jgi:two-component system sensor histidine kinase YesM
VVTIGRAVYDIDSQQRTGIMMMNISTLVFERILGKLGYGDICIMGKDGSFLAGNRHYTDFFDESFFTEKITSKETVFDREKVLVSGCSVGNLPIVIMRVSPYAEEGIPFVMLYVLFGLLLVFIIMALSVGWFIRKNITSPVFALSESMEKNRQSGELKKIDVDVPYSELEMLKGDYNNMIDHVNELIATLIEKEKVLQKSEMRVLQEQIKPHFLYNSLETIGFLAMDAGADKVHDALETLGRFYRNFLSKGGREIPLSREVMIVKDYLALQKLRYGDIINDEYDIAPETENCIVPKLILQPLVENSIYHGIRLKGESGTILISSKMVDGRLNIVVRDTGVGMDREQIEKIISAEKENEITESDSFGLWGTIERVRIYTGRRDVVKIESEVGEYTEVTFII